MESKIDVSSPDRVELSIGELIDALTEALKVVTTKRSFQKGDRVKLVGTVTGVDKNHINLVDDNGRALTFRATHLQHDD